MAEVLNGDTQSPIQALGSRLGDGTPFRLKGYSSTFRTQPGSSISHGKVLLDRWHQDEKSWHGWASVQAQWVIDNWDWMGNPDPNSVGIVTSGHIESPMMAILKGVDNPLSPKTPTQEPTTVVRKFGIAFNTAGAQTARTNQEQPTVKKNHVPDDDDIPFVPDDDEEEPVEEEDLTEEELNTPPTGRSNTTVPNTSELEEITVDPPGVPQNRLSFPVRPTPASREDRQSESPTRAGKAMPDNQLPPWMPIVYLCSPGSELQAELPSPELIPVVLKGQPRQTVPFPVPNQPGKSVQVPVPQKSTPPVATTPVTRRGFTAGQDTVRTRIFKMLAKQPMTASEISKAVGHASCPSLVKDEGVCEKPRIRREDGTQYGKRGVVFTLTALGHKHLEQGVVDKFAAPQSFGIPWPEGR